MGEMERSGSRVWGGRACEETLKKAFQRPKLQIYGELLIS